jgi:hypothetical protein
MPQTLVGVCVRHIWRLKNRFVQRRYSVTKIGAAPGKKRCNPATVGGRFWRLSS